MTSEFTLISGFDPAAQAEEMVAEALTAMEGLRGRADLTAPLPEIQAVRNAPDDIRRRCIVLAATADRRIGDNMLSVIAREPAGLTLRDAAKVLAVLHRFVGWGSMSPRDAAAVLLGQIEDTWAGLNHDDRAQLREEILRILPHTSHPAVVRRLRALAAYDAGIPYDLIDDVTALGQAMRSALESSPAPADAQSALIVALAAFPSAGKPGKRWRADSEAALAAIAEPVPVIGALLDAATAAPDSPHGAHGYLRFATEPDEAFLCGLTLLAGRVSARTDSPELLPRLRRLALKAIAMASGQAGSPRSVRLANHCVKAIADAGLPASVTELLRTERGTRHGSLLRAVRAAIGSLAAAQGITRDELLELAVEDHGLAPDGTRRVPLEDGWSAVLQAGARTATIAYTGPDGKPRKSLPKAVREGSADALSSLKTDAKVLKTTIGNERARLDAALAADRAWAVDRWRDLYLGHPVTGQLARTLIWRFGDDLTGIPVNTDTVVTSDGTEVPVPAGEGTSVRLWHPVHAAADQVRAWRQLLIGRRVVQPVKQAFREVYVLTPAEETTGTYSNRFAGHVFGQKQARALMKGRSWAPVTLAWYDDGIDHGVARREYALSGDGQAARAEFFFDPADLEDLDGDLIRYCVSDQVRFFRVGNDNPVPLSEIPPLAFSEAMRDVDLFMGVTSIGADPEWNDRGEGRRFADYWQRFAFGGLNARAEVRREVLAGLIPLLSVSDRCALEENFLRVHGDLRTYRIHLGSGNILMSPNDQYLCVVAARDARAGKLFLPFDDDPVLSLILSKAFLLAEDTAITDPTITRQIGGR